MIFPMIQSDIHNVNIRLRHLWVNTHVNFLRKVRRPPPARTRPARCSTSAASSLAAAAWSAGPARRCRRWRTQLLRPTTGRRPTSTTAAYRDSLDLWIWISLLGHNISECWAFWLLLSWIYCLLFIGGCLVFFTCRGCGCVKGSFLRQIFGLFSWLMKSCYVCHLWYFLFPDCQRELRNVSTLWSNFWWNETCVFLYKMNFHDNKKQWTYLKCRIQFLIFFTN